MAADHLQDFAFGEDFSGLAPSPAERVIDSNAFYVDIA